MKQCHIPSLLWFMTNHAPPEFRVRKNNYQQSGFVFKLNGDCCYNNTAGVSRVWQKQSWSGLNMLSRKCCMFLHTAPLLYFSTVLLVSCLFVGVLPQGFGGFLSLFSFTFRNFGFMQEFSASSDSGKPPHYSHFYVLATHTYILNQFLCQNLYSLFSCSSSTLPFTTAALKLRRDCRIH